MPLPARTRQLRLDLALRFRPLANLGRRLSRGLALSGGGKQGLYTSLTRGFIDREYEWIKHWNIDEGHYFDLMSLYPALQRVFFVHIPKCGGTSIRQHLVTSYGMGPVPLPTEGALNQAISFMASPTYRHGPFLQRYLENTESSELRSRYLRAFAGYTVTADPRRLFILGHQRARELDTLYRPGRDMMFTTVREPLELLRSMAIYRVSHTAKNPRRQDSTQLLEAMGVDHDNFMSMLDSDPRALVEGILAIKPPSLTSYLSMDGRMDCDTVWRGLQERSMYVAHVSEQGQMLSALFNKTPRDLRKNVAEKEQGKVADFIARLQDDWIAPFVDPESTALYQRFERAGILGFWKNGGTTDAYLELLRSN